MVERGADVGVVGDRPRHRRAAGGARSDADVTCLVGPSMQYRPTPRSYLNVVSMFGTTREPLCQMFVIYGWQFGLRAGPSRGYMGGPASTIGN